VSTLFLTIGAAAPVLRPEVISGKSDLTFTPNRGVRIAVAVAGVSVLLWAAAAGLLKAMGRLRVTGDSYFMKALPLIGLAGAAVLGWILLNRKVFRRGDRFGVTLTPQGITGLNYGSARPVAWTEITDVAEANGVVAGLPVGLAHLVVRTADGSAYPVHQSQFCGGSMLTRDDPRETQARLFGPSGRRSTKTLCRLIAGKQHLRNLAESPAITITRQDVDQVEPASGPPRWRRGHSAQRRDDVDDLLVLPGHQHRTRARANRIGDRCGLGRCEPCVYGEVECGCQRCDGLQRPSAAGLAGVRSENSRWPD
jgi:hypothetical protein